MGKRKPKRILELIFKCFGLLCARPLYDTQFAKYNATLNGGCLLRLLLIQWAMYAHCDSIQASKTNVHKTHGFPVFSQNYLLLILNKFLCSCEKIEKNRKKHHYPAHFSLSLSLSPSSGSSWRRADGLATGRVRWSDFLCTSFNLCFGMFVCILEFLSTLLINLMRLLRSKSIK